jgi:hypothetical protein
MHSPAQYRQYAEHCERIARDGPPEQRAVLLDIAKAWRSCAEEAERQERATGGKGNGDGKG